MLIDDYKASDHYLPFCLPRVAATATMPTEYRSLDITASKAKLPRLVERVKRPAQKDRICGHVAAGYRRAPSASQSPRTRSPATSDLAG
jgi:hypothetical protein